MLRTEVNRALVVRDTRILHAGECRCRHVGIQAWCSSREYTGWAKKRGHRLMTILLSNLNQFKKFFTERFLSKFAFKRILKIPPRRAYVAALPRETLMSAKQAINDKLQGSVVGFLITKLRKVYC